MSDTIRSKRPVRPKPVVLTAVSMLLAAGTTAPNASPQSAAWPGWGGPSGDFRVPDAQVAERWDTTPPTLWSRDLGPGYSAVASDGSTLYTQSSSGDRETLHAIAAATGADRWEQTEAIHTSSLNFEYGRGPHASPVIAGDLVLAIGSTGRMTATRRDTGEEVWRRELWSDLGGTVRDRGYSSSPLVWRDRVIVMVGGSGKALMSFALADGAEIWRAGDFDNGHASPTLISLGGRDQVVAFFSGDVAGFDAQTGAPLWSHTHETAYGLNIATPVFGDDGVLFISSAYGTGSRGLRLRAQPAGVSVEELWHNGRVRLHFGTAIRRDGVIYFTSGDFGPAFLAAVRMGDGEILWRDRTFAKGSLLDAGDRALLLDEEGTLALLELRPDGFDVLGSARVLQARAWTVPSLVGSTLYLRDTRQLKAVDVGPQATRPGE